MQGAVRNPSQLSGATCRDTRTRHRAFTLIELLAVCGIITVLLAVLFPILSRARQSGYRVQCQSHLRQILQATLSYEAENQGFLPQPDCAFGGSDPGWLYTPPIGTPIDDAEVETGTLWPYLHDRAVYHCPMVSGPYLSGPSQVLTSYMMNVCVIACGARPYSFRHTLMRPGSILYWEAGEDEPGYANPGSWNDGCSFPPEGLTSRHNQGANVGTIDGGVEWLSADRIASEVNASPGRFWCDPDRADGH